MADPTPASEIAASPLIDWMSFLPGIIDKTLSLIVNYGLNLAWAVVILVLGRWLAQFVRKLVRQAMTTSEFDKTLVQFIGHLVYAIVLAFTVIAALNRLGIQTASFVAIIGAAGLAIGLAFQGALANFAAGVLIIIFRPIRVGDRIDAAGSLGTVEEIELFTTRLTTPDNKTVIIPNAQVTSGTITNYSITELLRVDMTFGIGYQADIDKARDILMGILLAHEKVVVDPHPLVAVSDLGDSSVNFVVRPWCKVADYWHVRFSVPELVKKAFDKEGIAIPFPQRDVHLYTVQKEQS